MNVIMRRIFLIMWSLLTLFLCLSVLIESPSAEEVAGGYKLQVPLGMDEDLFVIPENNPLTEEKIELGRSLFFDPRLSNNNTISCATCHNPELAFTDGQPVSTGIGAQKGIRSAPTIINRAFGSDQFWDGRVHSLEEQAKGPLINPVEMGMPSHDKLVQKLSNIEGYRKWFLRVFGTEVTLDHIVRAIASFERTVMSGNSPVDRYNYEGDETALSESAKKGLEIFKGKGRCTQCHAGFNFTDESFHNIGINWDKTRIDLGRFASTKTNEDTRQLKTRGKKSLLTVLSEANIMSDIGSFKTPTLREIANTTPYMHDGSFTKLRQVIDFYDNGGIKNPFLDKEIKKLNLSEQEKDDLIAFLKSLSGEGWQHIVPPDSFPK